MADFPGNIGFREAEDALERFDRLCSGLPEVYCTRLHSLLAASPDPDQALLYFDRLRQQDAAAFDRLAAAPAGLQMLAAVFANSAFLAEAIIAHPDWAESLLTSGDLHRDFYAEAYRDLLEAELAEAGNGAPDPLTLALFRRRQILRIAARDTMGLCTLSEVTGDLSALADAILDASYRRIHAELALRHGEPEGSGFAIISLGKLGGAELNYSSDIDLLFLYSRNGETAGPARITNKEFYRKVASSLTETLSTYTPAGLAYRVDLRLRPDGRLGEVAISLDGAKAYYSSRARDWELQMLIKARVSAGDRQLGEAFLDFVEPLIYSTTLDFGVVEAASEARQRIHEKRRRERGFNVKLAAGGIRDIEFLVQCLQRLHGGREPWVRQCGTLLALSRLHDKGLLSPAEYSKLAGAYQFLRRLEHRLQLCDDRQTHTLPEDTAGLDALARKLPTAHFGDTPNSSTLLEELHRHLADVREIYERVIHAQQPMYYTPVQPVAADTGEHNEHNEFSGPAAAHGGIDPPAATIEYAVAAPASNLVRFLDQRAPGLAQALARANLHRSRVPFENFLERVIEIPEYIDLLDRDAVISGYVFDIFEHSPYFAEQLIRAPELIEELTRLREPAAQGIAGIEVIDDATSLRRAFGREMFRIQAESICLSAPIFTTLERTSDLADATIAAACRTAVEQVSNSRGPASASYRPSDQLMVITMGRLGMREFDLGSDADLVFVLPDEDSRELAFWTRVAERIIGILTTYTGEGTLFSVDTRLRPNGREGPLVQTESAYKSYFANQAEAWESITYMKCRAVGGDLERGTRFLNELQEVDWRRYGQSGRSRKQLAAMRARVEKEQSGDSPLKAARGGYFDIDFALMYLRLRGAGIFFKVLNTPARIDVIEKMGHLDRTDADFLRDAATFYRAVDHGLRVSSGHAEGRLPPGGPQLEILENLVRRWTPDHLHDQPLDIELAQIQERTREFFDRIFHA
ncbi:MAG: bifunctional [glutamate--ammonia ligase]-adenylyl-L-tyrosine phosphorylase/[glutamate--ammonia-ligase] adenylyltransferase [bacterium]|jgi:glutamate-ammonia-ligase adenylyltransferase